ncbi:rRNA methyltransferase 3, mitochondrial-like [Hyalella azteca]|uniref:rRNA methyltransferase 3, mitochondrial-like n=1 Tax=Hyalella azteca TaxID=294128 RepID=A0A8B7NZI9_HYAAZ|nr:rRNA methyltransferase 3, mitochondrial-like [Hyalella azteca]
MALLQRLNPCIMVYASINGIKFFPHSSLSSTLPVLQLQAILHAPMKDQPCRYYKKFHRRPIKINPAKQDEGKILLGDYVKKTSATFNKDVLEETKNLNKIVKATLEDTNLGRLKDEDRLLNHDFKSEQRKVPSEDNIDREVQHTDPDVQKALKAIKYVPLEEAPPQFRVLGSHCASRKLRHRYNVVLLEGHRLLQEAISAGLSPISVMYSRKNLLLKIMPKDMTTDEKIERLRAMNVFSTAYKKMSTWSSVVAGQGIMGVFNLSDLSAAYKLRQQPRVQKFTDSVHTPLGRRVTLVLDALREPGNVGALIRTAAGVGVSRVVLTKGCCDPWESKALRAGCGGHFSVEIRERVAWSRIYTAMSRYPCVYIADVGNSDREPLTDATMDENDRVAGGDNGRNYGNVKEERSADRLPRRESRIHGKKSKPDLSVREDVMRRGDTLDDEDEKDEAEEEKFFGDYIEVSEDGTEHYIDNSFLDEENLKKFSDVKLPQKLIHDISFFSPNIPESQDLVLVIGGETGLSNHAKKFALDNLGEQVSIPLHNSVDSLNTSVASGIILYEMWKQLQDACILGDKIDIEKSNP